MSGGRRAARLFVEAIAPQGQTQRLPKMALTHVRVLRLSPGAQVEVFDGAGRCADAELLAPEGRSQSVRVGAARDLPPQAARLTLVACMPKGNRLDPVVRMITELGVAELRLARSERTVPTGAEMDARLTRLQRIAREACAQSGQPHALRIEPPRPLLEVAAGPPQGAHRLLFWERANAPIPALPRAAQGAPVEVWAVVGPEGGLSAAEADALVHAGYTAVGLGAPILRVDTALVAIATLLLDRIGGLHRDC